jgi:hypothetical protein
VQSVGCLKEPVKEGHTKTLFDGELVVGELVVGE